MHTFLTRAALAAALLALGAYLAVVLGLFVLQRQFLFVPSAGPTKPAEAGLPGFSREMFQTADGLALPFWERRASAAGAPLVLYFHGNAGGLHAFAGALGRLADQGYGVAAMEYRGYPGAPGSPSEEAIAADARRFAAAARARQPGRRLVLWGYSLGSGVATRLAAEHGGADAVVLEAPFASARARAAELYPYVPVAWLMRDPFDSLSRMARIGAPLLILHGGQDRIVPAAQSELLFQAAREPKERRLYPAAGHGDLAAFGAFDAAFAFIAAHANGGAGAPPQP